MGPGGFADRTEGEILTPGDPRRSQIFAGTGIMCAEVWIV